MDSICNEQLWAAAVDRKITDGEFGIGIGDEVTFDAHRSLLSTRSPVFTANSVSLFWAPNSLYTIMIYESRLEKKNTMHIHYHCLRVISFSRCATIPGKYKHKEGIG